MGGLRILLFIVVAACCGYTDGKESDLCRTIEFSDSAEKNFAVSLKNGTRLVLEFTLDYSSAKSMKRSEQSSHHVDFSSTTDQVVIRLKFSTKCKADTCSESNITISSLRHKQNDPHDTPVTVGMNDVVSFSHSPTKPRIHITLLITDQGYYFEIVAERGDGTNYDPVTLFRAHNYYNYIPYQTTDVIYLALRNLTVEICYTPDGCEGVCLSCPPGTVLLPHNLVAMNHPNSTNKCNECGPGNYSVVENQRICQLCKPGTYNDRFSRTSCEECLSGTSTPDEGSTSCEECRTGRYAPRPGAHQCTVCKPGSVTEAKVGAKQCKECEIGSYAPAGGFTQCTECPEGSVTPQAGAEKCSECGHAGALNGTHCTCVAGTRRLSASKCEGCSDGTYTPRDNMMKCVECAGKVRSDNTCECPENMELKDDVCVRIVCRPGQKLNSDGTCARCPRGRYSNEEDSKTCLECGPGSYQSEEGHEHCTPCPKGTAQHLRGARWCMHCQMSGYQDNEGQSVCKHCHGTVNSTNHTCHKNLFKCLESTTYYPNLGALSWPAASDDRLVTVVCPYGGTAQRECRKNRWLVPVLSFCNSEVSEEVNQLINRVKNEGEETAIRELKNSVSEQLPKFGPRDIERITTAIADTPITNTQVATSKLRAALMMTDYNTQLQHVLDSSAKDRIVSIVDEGVGYLVDNGVKDLEKFSTEDVSISVTPKGTFSKHLDQKQMVSITQNATFSSVVFHNSKLSHVEKDSDLLTSEVLSVSLHGAEVQDGFNIDLAMRVVLEGTAECRWYDTDRSVWSTSGCHVTSRAGDLLHCQCNHLTSFAVFTSLSGIPEGHKQAQSVLSTLLFVISIIACVFTIIAYVPIRALRSRLIVQVEMMEITALILANITFLSLAHAQHQSTVCTGLVFGVHYLYLVTIAWSLVAALTFYRQIVTAIHSYGKTYQHTFAISFLLCWILPLVFPSFALIYSQHHGMSYVADLDGEFGCWISPTWKTYTFILPILVIVFVNTVIGVRVIIVMLRAANNNPKQNGDNNNWEIKKKHLKSILSLVMLFGTSFLLSIFTYGPHALVFQYLFICFTCSQGLVIFILFVPLRPEVHSEWKSIIGSSPGGNPLLSSRNFSRTETASSILSRQPSKSKLKNRRDTVVDRCVQS